MKFTSVLSYLALAAATAAAPLAELPAPALAEAGSNSTRGTNANEARGREGNCNLHVKWTKNFREKGMRRYRVKAWAEPGGSHNNTHEMVEMWTEFLEANYVEPLIDLIPGLKILNLRYWYTNKEETEAMADISFGEGKVGHDSYLNYHQGVLNEWRSLSKGCDVTSDL